MHRLRLTAGALFRSVRPFGGIVAAAGRIRLSGLVFLVSLGLVDASHWSRYLEVKALGGALAPDWHARQFGALWQKDVWLLLVLVFASFIGVETYHAIRQFRFDRWMICRMTRASWLVSLAYIHFFIASMTMATMLFYVCCCLVLMPLGAPPVSFGLGLALRPILLFGLVGYLAAAIALLWYAWTKNRWTAVFSPVFVGYAGIVLHERFLPERYEISLKYWLEHGLAGGQSAWSVLLAASACLLLIFAGCEYGRLRRL